MYDDNLLNSFTYNILTNNRFLKTIRNITSSLFTYFCHNESKAD